MFKNILFFSLFFFDNQFSKDCFPELLLEKICLSNLDYSAKCELFNLLSNSKISMLNLLLDEKNKIMKEIIENSKYSSLQKEQLEILRRHLNLIEKK